VKVEAIPKAPTKKVKSGTKKKDEAKKNKPSKVEPKNGTLSNKEARDWYLKEKKKFQIKLIEVSHLKSRPNRQLNLEIK